MPYSEPDIKVPVRRFNEPIFWTGIALGVGIAVLTLYEGVITWTSANKLLGAIQMVATTLMVPGLLVAAVVGSLLVGALGNLMFYWLLGGLASLIIRRKP